jgi:arginyl-tRNA synthetase
MNLLAELRGRFAEAIGELVDDGAAVAELAAMVMPSQDARFGDYQCNCAMPLGKRLGKPPREVAAALVERLELADLCEPLTPASIAGPGFINLRLSGDFLAERLAAALTDVERQGVRPTPEPRTIVLDYSSPNVAKPMHVGHIRSTVIGDALYRILTFLGHRVISDNHVGDWGTQFGMIIYGWKHFGDEAAFERAAVPELSRLYRLVNSLVEYHETKNVSLPAAEARAAQCREQFKALQQQTAPVDAGEQKKHAKRVQAAKTAFEQAEGEVAALGEKLRTVAADAALKSLADAHPRIGSAVLAETAALHAGDPTNRALWERFLPPCLAEIEETYRRLGVHFDHALGESFYEERLPHVASDFQQKGLARESDGALCVFLDGYEAPMLIRKQDGAFLYATTDLATIEYRMREWRPDALLYVVDHRQSLHFEQLFAAARLWGYGGVELRHISFGTVLGDDGRPFKTRSGSSVGLMGLLDEAVERALAIVAANDDARPTPLLSESERRIVAERVGIGAIKYADLAHNRTSDYKFSYDKMLAMTGNTAAYMQYSCARVRSIFGKGDVDIAALRRSGAAIRLDDPAERALGLAILQLAEALERVTADYRPNLLTDYLFDLAGKYSSFFENCPVLRAETDAVRTSRLLLCDLTARTLELGLGLLGIETVERM